MKSYVISHKLPCLILVNFSVMKVIVMGLSMVKFYTEILRIYL